MLDFTISSNLTLGPKQTLVNEDDYGVLNENILGNDSPNMSPRHGHRRESFADSTSAFSPTDSTWSDYPYNTNDSAEVPVSANSVHSFMDQGRGSFIPQEASQRIAYGHQPSTWLPESAQGSCTPTTVYESLAPCYDSKSTRSSYPNAFVHPLQPSTYRGLPLGSRPNFQLSTGSSTSPQSGHDWMSASSSEHVELQSVPKRERPESPTYHCNPPLLRRDGIRKKNARFEIPAERTLRNIDNLINQTCDEQEIKELKQQKRLLRNRQAALDSRQRKKQHTERLEEEKKQTSTIINELEEALGEMKLREVEWAREKESWVSSHQQCQQYIDQLVMDKEEMVRSHTLETGDLRKKNNYLVEQVQKLEGISMSAAPSSTGYSTDFSDFDHLTMDSSSWDNFSVVPDFNIETDPQREAPSVVLLKKEQASKDDDRPATSGFLLMLLLCGAWVASNSASTTPPAIPRMPEDVRMASGAVLDSVYQDAGLRPYQLPSSNSNDIEAVRTGVPGNPRKTTLSASEIASISHSPLESLHHRLVSPTEEQERDQMFSLTADHFNGINSDDFFDEAKPPQPTHRRNLAEALAAMRAEKQGSAAEIYTRSLMWDEVPREVVRDFARMVAWCNGKSSRGSEMEPMS